MKKKWLPVSIKPFNKYYKISNKGDIKSLDRYCYHPSNKVNHFYKGKPLKSKIDKYGYKTISLHANGISKHFCISRLVALAFIPNPKNKPQINHKNGVKTDNKVINLEWATPSENMKHAYRCLGRTSPFKKGEKHINAKLTNKQVLQIRKLHKQGLKQQVIADRFNIRQDHVSRIVNKIDWHHV